MTRRLRFAALAAVAALAFSACANNDAKESDVVNAMEDAGLPPDQARCVGKAVDDEFGDDQDLYNKVAAANDPEDFPAGDKDKYPEGTKAVIDDILARCVGGGDTTDTTAGTDTTDTTAGTDTTGTTASTDATTTETTAAPAG